MNELVKINGQDWPVIVWRGQRVITSAQLAEFYETDTDNVKKNFNYNQGNFSEGIHYFYLHGEELKEFKRLVTNFPQPLAEALKFTPQLYLWTHQGASRHCKILGTKKAWVQFDILEDNYYNPRPQEEIEEEFQQMLLNPDTIIQMALNLKAKMAENDTLKNTVKEKELRIADMQPKVNFANAVATSHTSILVGDLAKLLKQNGVDIGANRLFEWLRENGYLIKRRGADWNMPTQKSMDLGLFGIKESTVNNPDGSVRINKTPKVTGYGQQYFINIFVEDKRKEDCN